MKTRIFIVCCCLMIMSAASAAWGHMLWINVDNYHPNVGETVQIEIAWGHHFPKDEIVAADRLAKAYAINPKGEGASLIETAVGKYELTVKDPGVYLVYAEINPGVYTKTTDGFKKQNKKGLENALHCVSYDMRAKAIINVGDKENGISHQMDDVLETVPLENPAALKKGDILPLNVSFKKKPLSHDYVFATYVGFSEEMETYAFTAMLNRDGIAKVKILENGVWLVKIPHKMPYPDATECDEYFYCSTLTFEIK